MNSDMELFFEKRVAVAAHYLIQQLVKGRFFSMHCTQYTVHTHTTRFLFFEDQEKHSNKQGTLYSFSFYFSRIAHYYIPHKNNTLC